MPLNKTNLHWEAAVKGKDKASLCVLQAIGLNGARRCGVKVQRAEVSYLRALSWSLSSWSISQEDWEGMQSFKQEKKKSLWSKLQSMVLEWFLLANEFLKTAYCVTNNFASFCQPKDKCLGDGTLDLCVPQDWACRLYSRFLQNGPWSTAS